MNQPLPTLELVSQSFHGDTETGIYYLLSLESDPPSEPTRPVLPANHGVGQVLEYAKKLEKYLDDDLPTYHRSRIETETYNSKLDILIKEYIAHECGLDKFEPSIQYQIINMAEQRMKLGGYIGFYQGMRDGCRLYSPVS